MRADFVSSWCVCGFVVIDAAAATISQALDLQTIFRQSLLALLMYVCKCRSGSVEFALVVCDKEIANHIARLMYTNVTPQISLCTSCCLPCVIVNGMSAQFHCKSCKPFSCLAISVVLASHGSV